MPKLELIHPCIFFYYFYDFIFYIEIFNTFGVQHGVYSMSYGSNFINFIFPNKLIILIPISFNEIYSSFPH